LSTDIGFVSTASSWGVSTCSVFSVCSDMIKYYIIVFTFIIT
jgi:hypothetical protein